MENAEVYSVGELTHYIKARLEQDKALQGVRVSGEVSGLTQHTSGHVYFTLKDQDAQISCAMFKGVAMRYYRKLPKQGQKTTLRGSLSVYPPRGSYQFIVSEMEVQDTQGDLHARFVALKEKLQKEGLFDPAHKQELPAFPARIGIVTSPTGAALRDMLLTLERLWPHVTVVLSPALVQGDGSAASVAKALNLLDAHGRCDVILLARGGGSMEDLWTFNEEAVARAIFDCETPIISGVGHETDVTIADFVADKRASTPTAAAEMCVPDTNALSASLDAWQRQLNASLERFIDYRRQWLDTAEGQLRASLERFIDYRRQWLDDHSVRLEQAMERKVRDLRNDLRIMEVQLAAADVRQVLERGFTVTTLDGQRILDASALRPGDLIETHYLNGKSASRIVEEQ